MKTIGLLAVLLTMAGPAWALNDGGAATSEPNFYAFIHAVDFILLGIVLGVIVGSGWLLWRLVRFILAFLAYQTARYQNAAKRESK